MSLDCHLKLREILCKDSIQQLGLKGSPTSSREICQFDTNTNLKFIMKKIEA